MLKGFIRPDGARVKLEDVPGSGGWGWMKPVISSMAEQELNQERLGDYRVSDLGPVRIHLLERRYGYYVNPLMRVPLWKGSILHRALATGNGDDLQEKPLFATIHDATLVGKPDRYYIDDGYLIDYKFSKCYCYSVIKKELEMNIPISHRHEYVQKIWAYNWLLQQNGYDVKKRSLIIEMCDWSATSWQSQPENCIMELEIPVPPDNFEQWLFDWIEQALLFKAQPDEALPMCDEEVRYGKDKEGNFKRCRHYCDVQPFCQAIASHEQFEWAKGYAACKKQADDLDILLQNVFNVSDPSELRFRFQWLEVFEHIRRQQ